MVVVGSSGLHRHVIIPRLIVLICMSSPRPVLAAPSLEKASFSVDPSLGAPDFRDSRVTSRSSLYWREAERVRAREGHRAVGGDSIPIWALGRFDDNVAFLRPHGRLVSP